MQLITIFFKYTLLLFVKPVKTIQAISEDKQKIIIGILGLLFLTVIYLVGISVGIVKNNAVPNDAIFLKIPEEKYYFYELFFLLPVAVSGTILAAGAVRLTSILVGGKGDFETSFSLWDNNFIAKLGLARLAWYHCLLSIRNYCSTGS